MTQREWASSRLLSPVEWPVRCWARRPVVRSAALGGHFIPPTDSEPNLQSSNTPVGTPVDCMHLTPRSNSQGRRFNTNSGATPIILPAYGREQKRSSKAAALLSPLRLLSLSPSQRVTLPSNNQHLPQVCNFHERLELGGTRRSRHFTKIHSFSLPFNKPPSLQPLAFCSSRCRLCPFLSVLVPSCSFTIHTTLPP